MACPSYKISTLLLVLLNFHVYSTSARHIHWHGGHRHVHRDVVSASTSSSERIIRATAVPADLGIDVQTLQNDLQQFPGDLFNFISDVAERLDQLEALLKTLMDPTSVLQTELPQGLITSTRTVSHSTSLSALEVRPSTGIASVQTPVASADVPSPAVTGSVPAPSSIPISSIPTSATIPLTNSSNPAATNITPPTLNPETSDRKLSPHTSKNLAVYYGITPATTSTGLLTLCAKPSISIINLAFLTTFFGPNNYPTISFGPGCTGPNPIQSATAPGLSSCPILAAQILACQKHFATKILISLGGWNAASSFSSAQQAVQFARTLWNLFGGGSALDPLLRPFGPDIKVDGFDIDNENHNPAYYVEFATALRKLYAQDKNKRYYISAAPQCPRPDESIPLSAMRGMDFVHVQFYNNPRCNLDSTGFLNSVRAWSRDLLPAEHENGTNRSTAKGPLMFIGAPAWAGGAGSGYLAPEEFERTMGNVRALGLENLGGVMLWDGSEGQGNVGADGRSFIDVAGRALH